jgi:protein-tyrosine phosphatase
MKLGLDLSWITNNLAIGGSFRPVMVGSLREMSIRRVVDLRAERCDDRELLERHGIQLLHLPTPDLAPIDRSAMSRGADWVCDGLERGEGVLVHCEHGIGRSASLACCVLMQRGFDLPEALSLLVRTRPGVAPTAAQLEALLFWAAARGEQPLTWGQVVSIIYRVAA